VKNFLQHFRIGNQTLARCNQALQDELRFCLVGMGSPDQLDRDVGIDEDHSW
jgi:hypothetical protein